MAAASAECRPTRHVAPGGSDEKSGGSGSSGYAYLTKSQIDNSPSRQYLLDTFHGDVEKAREKETLNRRVSCAFLQQSGQKLRLPQLTIATAIVFYHRFFAHKSYQAFDRFSIATTCLFLASKVEETPKKLKNIVSATYAVQHANNPDNKPEKLDPESHEFFEMKEKILISERILLQTLGFDLTVEHAYRPLLAYVKSIQGTRDLAQIAWNFINDSLRTTICLQYAPRCVSAAAVYLAAEYLSGRQKQPYVLPPHEGGNWYDAFQVSEEDFQDVAKQIMELYEKTQQGGQCASLSNGSHVAEVMTQRRPEAEATKSSAPAEEKSALAQSATGAVSDTANVPTPASAPAVATQLACNGEAVVQPKTDANPSELIQDSVDGTSSPLAGEAAEHPRKRSRPVI
eukprot:CAMPEP_0119305206 /NCGR_PEP_ID=MMETSP1333-20130426/6249_1 /TAXON_ID=418940 /ORGANISM="Scyphosphaera apsteinii, Strain RCC1455" /LENGTH=399 /DNA_ID=CAMNT_0007308235 /DNA_START=26 /DNA_END=1225 /DNA_ORIENTATION=+